MYQDRYKLYGSPKKKQFIENYGEPSKQFLSKLSGSPKKKHASPQYVRKSYFEEDIKEQNNHAQRERCQYNLNCQKDAKLSALIYKAISSADRVVKQILNYELPQLEGLCSRYFLSKQKLYSYLHSETIALPTYKSKHSKLSKFKSKKEENQSELKEQVSLKQLKRLESIVYDKIIPQLKQETHKERKKQKYSKIKRQIQVANPEQREGIYLLQKLNSKGKKFNLDDYIEVLEKYILKVMDKQTNLMAKVDFLQQELEEQINKVQEYQNFIKKREEEKHEDDIQRANQLKRMVRYEEFVKSIQSMLKQQQEDYFTKETENLDSLASKIRKLLKQESDKKEKKCIHRQKSSKQHTDSEQSRSEQQQKMQKEVIRNLNKQVGDLKQFCQQLQEKLRNNNNDILKAQTKERKLMRQNESLCLTIQKLTEDLNNANKMIEQYLLVVGRLDEELKQNQDNLNRLRQDKQKEEQQNKSLQEKNQQLLKHIEETEQRYRQIQELAEKKEKQYEQLVQNLYTKQLQIKQLSLGLEKYEKEVNLLNTVIVERQQIIIQLQQKVKAIQALSLNTVKQPRNAEINQVNGDNQSTNSRPAIIVDDLFIDDSEPNHHRQDFIPVHRFKDQPQQKQTQINHLPIKQTDQKLLSQVSSQKQSYLQQSQNNHLAVDKKSHIIGLQSEKTKKQENQFIRIEVDKQIKSQPDNLSIDKIQKNPQTSENDRIETNAGGSQVLQNANYEELMNTTQKIRQKIIQLIKLGSNNHSPQEIEQFNKEIQNIESILQMCAKNTSQKLKRLQKLQTQNKLAFQEIQYLRSKLQAANLKNIFVSNIPSQSQSSGFSLDGQLRQVWKKSPFAVNNVITQKYSDIVQQNNKKIQKQEVGVQTESLLHVQNFVQSEVFRYLPEIKRILSREEVNQTMNQSLIDQLDLLNINKFHQSLKLQRVQPPLFQDEGILNTSSPQKNHQQQVQTAQNLRKARFNILQNSVQDLSNLMNYHKERYLNLHNLFKKTSSKNFMFQTPIKKPLLQNEEYVEQIMQAPEKQLESDLLREEQKVVEKLQERLNESPINKQNVYQLIALQKQEQNLKLKQIIEKLSSKQSQKEQKLETEQKMKQQLLQKNKLLQAKLAQLMSSNQQLRREIDFLKIQRNKDASQKIDADQEVVNFKELAKQFQNLQLEKQQQNIKEQNSQKDVPLVVQQKIQKPSKQKTEECAIPKERARSSSQANFGWKDLIPQYFGAKNHKK